MDNSCLAGAPGRWKQVDLASPGDRERRHNLLDFTAHRALLRMMDELDAAWHSELARLDILKLPVDDYIDQ